METAHTEVTSIWRRNDIEKSTWRTHRYFVNFKGRRIHVKISTSNRRHKFYVDSPIKINEISTNFPRGMLTMNRWRIDEDVSIEMGGLDLVDQRTAAYHLDRKSSIRFYLRIFFYLMDVGCANSCIAHDILHLNDLTLLNFKIAVATHMIRPYTSTKRTVPDNNIGSKRAYRFKHEPTEVQTTFQSFDKFAIDVFIVMQGA